MLTLFWSRSLETPYQKQRLNRSSRFLEVKEFKHEIHCNEHQDTGATKIRLPLSLSSLTVGEEDMVRTKIDIFNF